MSHDDTSTVSSFDQTFITPPFSKDPSFTTASPGIPASYSDLSEQLSSLRVVDNPHGHGAGVGGSPPLRATLIDRLYCKSDRELPEEQISAVLKEKQRKAQVCVYVQGFIGGDFPSFPPSPTTL